MRPFAELGVMFLLFLIGIEMSTERLWSLRRFVAGIGSLQFLVSAVAFRPRLSLLGAPGAAAIILGLGLAMSSTAVVMQLLEEQGRTATPLGRVAIAVLLFQDLMVAPVLFGVGDPGARRQCRRRARQRAPAGGGRQSPSSWSRAVSAAPAVQLRGRTGSRELIMAMTLLLVIAPPAATGYAGFSTALGAFLAGVLLSETEYRHQVEIDIAPFKGLLLGLFFITVGMSLDVRMVWTRSGSVCWRSPALLPSKRSSCYVVIRLFRMQQGRGRGRHPAGAGRRVRLRRGRTRARDRCVPSELAQFATAVVAISMMLTPFLAIGGRSSRGRRQRREHRDHMPPPTRRR